MDENKGVIGEDVSKKQKKLLWQGLGLGGLSLLLFLVYFYISQQQANLSDAFSVMGSVSIFSVPIFSVWGFISATRGSFGKFSVFTKLIILLLNLMIFFGSIIVFVVGTIGSLWSGKPFLF